MIKTIKTLLTLSRYRLRNALDQPQWDDIRIPISAPIKVHTGPWWVTANNRLVMEGQHSPSSFIKVHPRMGFTVITSLGIVYVVLNHMKSVYTMLGRDPDGFPCTGTDSP